MYKVFCGVRQQGRPHPSNQTKSSEQKPNKDRFFPSTGSGLGTLSPRLQKKTKAQHQNKPIKQTKRRKPSSISSKQWKDPKLNQNSQYRKYTMEPNGSQALRLQQNQAPHRPSDIELNAQGLLNDCKPCVLDRPTKASSFSPQGGVNSSQASQRPKSVQHPTSKKKQN